MIQERANDGIERSREQWFKRYNRQEPEKGGARKSRVAVPQEWLEKIRKAWEREANGALERADGGGSTTTAWPTGETRRIDPATWSGRPS